MSYRLPFWSPAHADAFLFDWDGVIAETHLDFSGIREKYYGGRRAMLLEDAPSLEPDKRAAMMRDLEEREMRGARAAKPVPGIHGILSWVRERGLPWAVVSRNSRNSILEAARTIGVEMPPVLRSRDDGRRVKPDPTALLETCELLGADPRQTLFIGDFIYDMIGARRAGLRGVLVREKIDPGWDQWLECSYASMDDLHEELLSPREKIPWEYQGTVGEYGADFLRFAHSVALPVPEEAGLDLCGWLTGAASLGIGTLTVPKMEFSPAMWRKNQSFDPAWMGFDLPEAVRSFLERRYPFASVAASGASDGKEKPPIDPARIARYLLELMGGNRQNG